MSRFVQRTPTHEIAYGEDHVCGLFIQVFDRSRANDDNEGIIVDEDGISKEQMVSIAEEYGVEIQLPEEVIE